MRNEAFEESDGCVEIDFRRLECQTTPVQLLQNLPPKGTQDPSFEQHQLVFNQFASFMTSFRCPVSSAMRSNICIKFYYFLIFVCQTANGQIFFLNFRRPIIYLIFGILGCPKIWAVQNFGP